MHNKSVLEWFLNKPSAGYFYVPFIRLRRRPRAQPVDECELRGKAVAVPLWVR